LGNVAMTTVSKSLSYLEREGWRAFIDKAADKMLAPLFVHNRILIYNFTADKPVSVASHPRAIFNELSINDLPRLEKVMYQSRKAIEKRFKKGDRCFVAEIDSRIAHYTWLCFGEEYLPSIEKRVRVKENEAYIYNVYTVPSFRREGLFSFVLGQVLKQLQDSGYKKLWVSVLSNNLSSQNAFEKMGFEKETEIEYLRFLIFKKYRDFNGRSKFDANSLV